MSGNIKLSEIMNTYWKEFSIATCEERGIPQFADGLKPVQRFLLFNGYKIAKNKFDKVASLGSSVSCLGYEHGEASATLALTYMGAYHSNNLPLFEGSGNFGSILSPDSYAASRYIFAKLSPIIDYIFKDNDLCPENPDPEILTPLYYLPIVPLVLINGVKGIATGYAVDIPPHDPISIIDNLIKLCDSKKIKPIKPKYYYFKGNIERFQDYYLLTGNYEKKSEIHYVITDIPVPFYTSSSYEKHLRKLLDNEVISNYENNSCNDKFNYDVYLKKGTRWTPEQFISIMKLSVKHSWNITTVLPTGKLHIWNKETGFEDIIEEFYKFRVPFIQERINKQIDILGNKIRFFKGFSDFINDVTKKKFSLADLNEENLSEKLKKKYGIPEEYIEKVLSSHIRSFTTNKISELNQKKEELEKELEYYKQTTKEKEYKKDLEELKSHLNKLK